MDFVGHLHPLTFALASSYLLVVALPFLAWRARADLVEPVAGGAARLAAWIGVAVVWVFVAPRAPWATNHHDIDRLVSGTWGGWLAPGGMGELHGHFPLALSRLVSGLSGGALDASDTNLLTGWVGLIALGALGARRGGVGVGTALVLLTGLHPITLRLVGSGSPFVPFLALMAASLLTADRWARTGAPRLVPLLAALVLAWMQTRAEAMALAPALTLGWVLWQRPARLREAVREPGVRWTLLGALLLLSPRLVLLLQRVAAQGVPMFATKEGEAVVATAQRATPLLWLARGLVGVALLAALRPLLPGAARRPAWLGPILAGALVLALAWGLALPEGALAFEQGRWPELPAPWDARARAHGITHPQLTDVVLQALAVAGAVALTLHRPRAGLALAGGLALSVVVYAGNYDSLATLVRTSLPAVPWLAAAAVAGLGAVVPASMRPVALPVAALGLTALTLPPRLVWVSHRYPMQQEWSLLRAAMDLPDEVVLVAPSGADRTPGFEDDPRWYWFYRDDTARSLRTAGREVWTIDELIARGVGQRDVVWLQTPPCLRGVMPDPAVVPPPVDRWLVGDTVFLWRTRWLAHRDRFDLREVLPCWDDSAHRTCALPTGDGRCDAWACSEDAAPGAAFFDPSCAAVVSGFGRELLREEPVAEGNLSGALGVILSRDAELGLYRLSDPLDAD